MCLNIQNTVFLCKWSN